MPGDIPLKVVCERRGDTAVLIVHGEVDLSTVDILRDSLRSQTARAATVVLDLRGIRFIDSTGLSLIVSEQRRAREDGFRFAIAVEGSSAVQRLFELTGLEGALTLIEDPEALTA